MISIIVPIYKAEKYLRRCIDSILSQTYKDWELILVDDGSPDNSGKICDEYASHDKRIHVFHKENGGVSSARQLGLDNAHGDYSIHVDPDDYIEPTMLEDLYNKAIQENADIVSCDFYDDRNGRLRVIPQDTKDMLADCVNMIIIQSLCNKLIAMSVIRDNNIRFDNLSTGEDDIFLCRILAKGASFTHISKPYYHYCYYGNSLSHSFNQKKYEDMLKGISLMSSIVDISKYDNFYQMKRILLTLVFQNHQYDKMPTLFPDIHDRIINEGRRYNIFLPIRSCLSLCLRGHYRLAGMLYTANITLLNFIQRMKGILRNG